MKKKHSAITFAAIAILIATLHSPAPAQSYPDGPVTIVVPFAPGGAIDIQGRLFATRLSAKWNRPVIVDNRPGAGGQIGTEYVARAKPDGKTLLYNGNSVVTFRLMSSTASIDPFKDLTPISIAVDMPYLVMVPPTLPVKTLAEFIAYTKAATQKQFYASIANSLQQLEQIAMYKQAGINPTAVTYPSSSEILTALMTGQVQSYFASYVSTSSQIEAGKLKALAVTSLKRFPKLPDVPTVDETLPGYEAKVWIGFLGPPGIPDAIVSKLNADIAAVAAEPEVQQKLLDLGLVPVASSSREMEATMRKDFDRAEKMMSETGMKAK